MRYEVNQMNDGNWKVIEVQDDGKRRKILVTPLYNVAVLVADNFNNPIKKIRRPRKNKPEEENVILEGQVGPFSDEGNINEN